MIKRQKGITLIALIITIIVLLVLAGVSVNALFGESGVITNAREAKILQQLATLKEEIDMYVAGQDIAKITGIERFPVLNETMASIELSSIPEGLKTKLLQLATTVVAGEVPTLADIDYSQFYKLDKDKVASANEFEEDLYLWQDANGYKVITIKGVEYKGETIYVIIPLDDMADPRYITTSNNTYKLYGDGILKVIGQVNSYSTTDSSEINAYSGVKEFVMPEEISTDGSTVPYFSCGTAYVIDTQNRLWAWGDNSANKLGLGNSYTVTEPTIIKENVAKVWAGVINTWILGTDNKVYAAGSNISGGLGQGNTNIYNAFIEVQGIDGIAKKIICNISSGSSSNGAIIECEDGKVYGVGANNLGQLGLGNVTSQTRVIRLTHFEGVKKIVYAGYNTWILKENGQVWGCGYNVDDGRVGVGDLVNKTILTQILNIGSVEDIELYANKLMIKTDLGEIYVTGFGKTNSDGTTIYDGIPRKAELIDSNIILSSGNLCFLNGRIYTISYNSTTEVLKLVINYSSYTNVTENLEYPNMVIFKNNGKIYINGYPDITAIGKRVITSLRTIFSDASFVQGNGSKINIVTSVGDIYESLTAKNTELTNVKKLISSKYSTYALTKEGELYAKGTGLTGGWGDINSRSNYTLITANGINSLSKVEKLYISKNGYTAVFITEDNQIYWIGATGYTYLPNMSGDIASAGAGKVTAYPQNITNNGNVLKNIVDKIEEIQIVFINENGINLRNTLILTENEELYTMSSNSNVSGNGRVQSDFELLNIEGKKIVSVRTDKGLSMAVSETGEVYAWGYNYYGLMGEGYEVGGIYPTPQKLKIENIKEVELGEGFAIFIGKYGEIYGIGRNEYGQLGDGTTTSQSNFIRGTELEK